jgi:hypothetical protein
MKKNTANGRAWPLPRPIELKTGEPTIIGRVYRGFTISPAGSVIGFFWGLFDGLIGGAVFAWGIISFQAGWSANRAQGSYQYTQTLPGILANRGDMKRRTHGKKHQTR